MNPTEGDQHFVTYTMHKEKIRDAERILVSMQSMKDTLDYNMTDRLRHLTQQWPPLPDSDLIAYESAKEHALGVLDKEIYLQNKRLHRLREEFADWQSYTAGPDSSEEIEMMKEAAKANTRRSKRSRYDPDSGTNYALEA